MVAINRATNSNVIKKEDSDMFKWGLIFGAVVALIGYVVIAVMAAQRLVQPRRRYSHMEPGAVGLDYEDIWFQARGEALNISAWHLPSPGATRAVVIVHGLNRCRGREFSPDSFKLVTDLVAKGFTVLMLDLRGHGESDAARQTYGIRERRDVLGAVDWLLERGYAPGSIGILGTSMGGVAALGATVEEPAIGGLIIDSAFADFTPMMRTHFRTYSKLPAFFLPTTLLVSQILTGERFADLRPVEHLRAILDRPVLVIHARGDALVPVAHAQAFAQAADVELWLTDGASHLGAYSADPEAYSNRVTQFFQRTLANQPQSQTLTELMSDTTSTELAIETSVIDETDRVDELTLVVQTQSGGRPRMHWQQMSHGLFARWERGA